MATTSTSTERDANRDPITDEPGAHPVGVGIGTAAGGAAAGAAAGLAGGPIGAAIGAIVGGVAGGYAGKAAAEAIDPTEEDTYWSENYKSRSYVGESEDYDTYRPAYQYGAQACQLHQGRNYDDVRSDLESEWKSQPSFGLDWEKAEPAVRDAFDRRIQLHEEQLNVRKEQVKTGDVQIRKEVVSEQRQIEVPVEREEIVIERRPVSGAASTSAMATDMGAEQIRIPVSEEQVRVEKTNVVKEEVSIGKRKLHETETVAETVRHEELHVDNEGSTRVRETNR